MLVCMALTAATLVVNPSTGNTVSCAILARNVQFDDVENLTEKARNGKTRYMCNGSGFFVTADGDVVTNHHVVDGAEEVVVLWQGTAYRMRVVASDKERDLALLHPDEVKDDFSMDISFPGYSRPVFPPLAIGKHAKCEVGDTIYVVGYPQISVQGLEAKVTKGIVSSLSGFKGQRDNFQMDAAIQGGNSGGPVVDERGNVIGVSVATLRGGQNVNYAIKMDVVDDFLAGHVKSKAPENVIDIKGMIKRVVRSSVLVLCYEPGSRPIRFDTKTREGKERRAIFAQTVIYAKLLKVRKEWKELKKLTDSLIREYGDSVGDEIKELNELSKKNVNDLSSDSNKGGK